MSPEPLLRLREELSCHSDKVIRNGPTDSAMGLTTKINEVFGYQLAGACETLFRTFGDTRTAAGGGLTGDTLKCQLKPLDFASYPVTFTAAQQTRLQAAFPTGVCDWSKPGVDERPPLGTWLDYGT